MKIGILTFHNADNYGAVLQCWALQKTLLELFPDDKICVIDYKNRKLECTYGLLWDFSKKHFLWNMLRLCKNVMTLGDRIRAKRNFELFRATWLCLGSNVFSDYDVIVYGTDQIWCPLLTERDLTFFGKGFSGKKIAYAASDGNRLCVGGDFLRLLNLFTAVSVREKGLLKKLSDAGLECPIKVVCDPVLLVCKKDWLCMSEAPAQKDYVLAYRIGKHRDFDAQARELGERLGKQVIQIMYVKKLGLFFKHEKNRKVLSAISPNQFVGFFANASFVLTTSFHGTAFSILFEKPFYSLKIENGGERIMHLLETVGLSGQYVEQIPEQIVTEERLYSAEVKKRISAFSSESKAWIHNSLSGIGGGGMNV